ncbi:hypothetical protein HPB00_05415 [Streptococcus suis]|nr:hypothetical protein [Streptococcus suis]
MKANKKMIADMRSTKKVLVDFSLILDSLMSFRDARTGDWVHLRHSGIWRKNDFGHWDDVVIA